MRTIERLAGLGAALILAPLCSSCVMVADFRRLEAEVRELRRQVRESEGESARVQLADHTAELDRLKAEIRRLDGRVDVVGHRVTQMNEDLRAAAQVRSSGPEAAAVPDEEPAADAGAPEEPGAQPVPASGDVPAGPSAEVASYHAAYEQSRGGDPEVCVERFREFLQTYPSSAYADDAAYWMADCYYRMGDLRAAVLRFDDVVAGYPQGNKAADALFRQGQTLLELGPSYARAAGKAFERVIDEYPDSARVAEARRQLEVLGSR